MIYEQDKKHISIASLGKEIYNRTIVINGVSKSYAMTTATYFCSNNACAKSAAHCICFPSAFLPNTAFREVVERGAATAILPVDNMGNIILVRQYRNK